MKILFIAPGNSIHSKKWVEYFVGSANVEVEWISFEEPLFDAPTPRSPGGKGRLRRLLRTLVLIRRSVHRYRPEVVHVHSVARYGLFSLLVPRDRLVLTPWGSDVLISGKKPLRRLLLKVVLRRAALLTCDALHMKRELLGLGVNPDRVTIVNFGIDCQRFSPEGGLLRQEGQIFTVLSTRNLEPIYDLATLVRAVPLLVDHIPNVRVLIAGSGSQLDDLKSLAQQLGVSSLVEFVGRIPNDDLPALLRSVSVYVSTALSDAGIAGSTAEAMASGVPVVVSDTGENHLWVEDEVSGYLFEAGDEFRLADCVVAVRGLETAARDHMVRAARSTILDRNDYLNEMNKALELCRQVASP